MSPRFYRSPPLLQTPLCVLSIEASGLNTEAEVYEVDARIVSTTGRITDSFTAEGRPSDLERPNVKRMLKRMGVSVRELAERPLVTAQIIAAFDAWLTKHSRPPCVTYNQPFDRRLLHQSGLDGLKWDEDVMATASRALGYQQRKLRLVTAVTQLHVWTKTQGRPPAADARLIARVLVAARRKLKVQQ